MVTTTIEGYAHMSRDEWNVPTTVWVANAPHDQAEGVHLHTVCEDAGIPAADLFADKKWVKVRITVEVLDRRVS